MAEDLLHPLISIKHAAAGSLGNDHAGRDVAQERFKVSVLGENLLGKLFQIPGRSSLLGDVAKIKSQSQGRRHGVDFEPRLELRTEDLEPKPEPFGAFQMVVVVECGPDRFREGIPNQLAQQVGPSCSA